MLSGLLTPTHLLFVVVIALLVFGPKQLPRLARRAGRHARDTKHGMASAKEEFEQGLRAPPEPAALPRSPTSVIVEKARDPEA